jgi:hypothetical protein
MALESTQPLIEVCAGDLPVAGGGGGGKCVRCEGLTTFPNSCAGCTGSLKLLEPSRPMWACTGTALGE